MTVAKDFNMDPSVEKPESEWLIQILKSNTKFILKRVA